MLILYYCDFYFIFVLLLIFFFSFFKNQKFITINITNVDTIFLICKISLFYILFNLIDLNLDINSHSELKINFLPLYKITFLLLSFLFIFLFKQYALVLKWFNFEYCFIFVFALFSLSLILQAETFLSFYILLECYTLSICSVFVIKKLTKRLVDGAFKYLVFNIISSCLILFGISNIYFSTGLINFSDINQTFFFFDSLYFKNIFHYGYFLLFTGFAMKLAIFPFSIFLNEIYLGLPNVFVLFLLLIPKFTFVIFLFNNSFFYLNYSDFKIYFILFYLSLVTSVFHSFLSIHSLNIKNILINTSLANTPFFILPIFYKSPFVLTAFFNFIIVYSFTLISLFGLFFLFCLNKNQILKKITSLISLYYANCSLAILLLANLLSLASLPPFAGFFAKLFFFYFLIEHKMFFLYLFLSFINLVLVYSYLRIIRLFFIKKQNFYLKNISIKKTSFSYLLCFLTVFNTLFLFFFDSIYSILFILLNSNLLV